MTASFMMVPITAEVSMIVSPAATQSSSIFHHANLLKKANRLLNQLLSSSPNAIGASPTRKMPIEMIPRATGETKVSPSMGKKATDMAAIAKSDHVAITRTFHTIPTHCEIVAKDRLPFAALSALETLSV